MKEYTPLLIRIQDHFQALLGGIVILPGKEELVILPVMPGEIRVFLVEEVYELRHLFLGVQEFNAHLAPVDSKHVAGQQNFSRHEGELDDEKIALVDD